MCDQSCYSPLQVLEASILKDAPYYQKIFKTVLYGSKRLLAASICMAAIVTGCASHGYNFDLLEDPFVGDSAPPHSVAPWDSTLTIVSFNVKFSWNLAGALATIREIDRTHQ